MKYRLVTLWMFLLGVMIVAACGWAGVTEADEHPVVTVVLVATAGLGVWISLLGARMYRDRIR